MRTTARRYAVGFRFALVIARSPCKMQLLVRQWRAGAFLVCNTSVSRYAHVQERLRVSSSEASCVVIVAGGWRLLLSSCFAGTFEFVCLPGLTNSLHKAFCKPFASPSRVRTHVNTFGRFVPLLWTGGPNALTVYEIGIAPTPEPTPSPTPAPTPPPTPEPPCGDKDIIIEAEDILRSALSLNESLWGGWDIYEDLTYASGGEYISWMADGNVNLNNKNFKDGDPMYYEVDVVFPGAYKFQYMCRQPPGIEENDKGNDAWVVFKDAVRYGPEEGGSYPNHVNNEGFIKIFGGNRNNEFKEKGRGNARDEITVPVAEFDVAGPTTMGLAGRSYGYQIDQIILRAICED